MEPISREQFEPVRALLEGARRRTRPRVHDLYDVFVAVLHFIDTGGPWRSMPGHFPPWRTVHEYYTQWTLRRHNEATLLERALELLGRQDLLDKLRSRLARHV
jgi:transposase